MHMGKGLRFFSPFHADGACCFNGPTCLERYLGLAILLSGLEEEYAARQEPLSLVLPLDMHAR